MSLLTGVILSRITYEWKAKEHIFFVYGYENKVSLYFNFTLLFKLTNYLEIRTFHGRWIPFMQIY